MDMTITIGVGVVSLVSFIVIVKFLVNAFLNHQTQTQMIMHADLKTKICDNRDEIKHNRRTIDRNTTGILELAKIHAGLTVNKPLNPSVIENLKRPPEIEEIECKSDKQKFEDTMKEVAALYPPKTVKNLTRGREDLSTDRDERDG